MTFKKWLNQLLSDIFAAAWAEDICGFENTQQLADAAGLSWQTVRKLETRDTRSPHLRSVFALARAVGMDMRLVRIPNSARNAA